MRYITPPGSDAAFHFSVETYFTEHAPLDEPLFMIWQADNTAMLGLYQIPQAEISLPYAQEAGIRIVRRQSGGGTIFTDMGTLLYTLILPHTEEDTREILRETFAGPMVRALNKMGVPAKLEGRNDLLVDGKKVCGIAQFVRNGQVCTHGSLLYDTDLDMLTRVLQVEPGKIQSKAIASVRSRVTNMRKHMDRPVSTQEFWALLEEKLAEEWSNMHPYILSETELQAIQTIYTEKFNNPAWTEGRTPRFTFRNSCRFPAGKVEVFLDIAKGVIVGCSICGDFLGIVPMRGLEAALEHVMFQPEQVAEALADVDLQPYLGEVTKDQLLSCLFDRK